MSGHHELKTEHPYFEAVWRGDKTFEVRRDDRDFQTGDTLCLVEIPQPPPITGAAVHWLPEPRRINATISYILHGPKFGIEAGFCVLGIQIKHELVAK